MSFVSLRLPEWKTVGPDDPDGSQLRGLKFSDPRTRSLAEKLAKEQVVEVSERHDGLRVTTRAHVGRIQLGPLLLSIEPKLGSSELLALLRYTYGLRDLELFDPIAFSSTGELLQDLIAAQLLAEITELVQRGLLKNYVARASQLSVPRGRIDMRALASRAPIVDARLPCRHYERAIDHTLNRALVGGLALAARLVSDLDLRRSLLRIRRALSTEVSEMAIDHASLRAAWRAVDRRSVAYEPALRLIELLYMGSGVSLADDATLEVPGFLFDMNRFFQALMARFLRENLDGYQVEEEESLRWMMRYLPARNPRRRKAPRPRPDFVVRQRKCVLAILDAKYRDLWERDLPRDMLYQLAMYSLSQPRAFTSAILYPTSSSDAVESVIEIRDPLGDGALGFVALRPVILDRLVRCIRDDVRDERAKMSAALAGVLERDETVAAR